MPHEPRDVREYAALAGMCLIWGSTFLIIRIGNEAVPPFWAASIRLIIAIPLYRRRCPRCRGQVASRWSRTPGRSGLRNPQLRR